MLTCFASGRHAYHDHSLRVQIRDRTASPRSDAHAGGIPSEEEDETKSWTGDGSSHGVIINKRMEILIVAKTSSPLPLPAAHLM